MTDHFSLEVQVREALACRQCDGRGSFYAGARCGLCSGTGLGNYNLVAAVARALNDGIRAAAIRAISRMMNQSGVAAESAALADAERIGVDAALAALREAPDA